MFGNQYVHFNIRVPTYASLTAADLHFYFIQERIKVYDDFPVFREVTQRQRELIEEFDKEECADRERLAAASG